MAQGAKGGVQRNCRYEHDTWLGNDGRLYIKVTAIEFERATEETFALSGRRRLRVVLETYGLPSNWANGLGNVEVWDIARDWASDMPEAYTFRTRVPLPVEVLDAAAA